METMLAAKLDQFAKGIPPKTLKLYLDVNDITSIESQRIKRLKSLKRLDISNK